MCTCAQQSACPVSFAVAAHSKTEILQILHILIKLDAGQFHEKRHAHCIAAILFTEVVSQAKSLVVDHSRFLLSQTSVLGAAMRCSEGAGTTECSQWGKEDCGR